MASRKPSAAVYLRKSTVDARGIFEEHRRNVAALARRLGAAIDPDLTFVEDDVSASKPRAADTAWGHLVAAVERAKPGYVLAQAADRLGRRLADLEGLDDQARRIGFQVWTVTENDLFASPIWPFIAARAKTESMYTSIRVRAAQEKRRREGKPHGGGSRPYGYTYDRMSIVDDEAAIIREIARRILGGERAHAIAQDLNARGVPTTDGGRWSRHSTRALVEGRPRPANKRLADEVARRSAAGESWVSIAAEFNRRGVKLPVSLNPKWSVMRIRNMLARPRYAGQYEHKKEVISTQAAWPAILELEEWRALQVALAETAGTSGRPHTSLLGGLLMCTACSPPEPMYASAWGDKAGSKVYRCQNHSARRMDVVEEYVLSRVLPAVSVDEIAAKQDAIMADDDPTRGRILELDMRIAEATDAYEREQIAGRDFYPLLNRLRKARDAAEHQHDRAMREFDALNDSARERDHFAGLSHEGQRAFLRRHMHAVEVKPRRPYTSIASPIDDSEVRLIWR